MNVQDYQQYYQSNAMLLQKLEEENLFLSHRFQDLIKVLDYIVTLYEGSNKIEEDFEVIFEVGYVFLFHQFEDFKNYFTSYLESDYVLLKKYDTLINYTLYLDDLYQVLQDKDNFTEEQKKVFLNVQTSIEEILKNKAEVTETTFEEFNDSLEEVLLHTTDTITTLEVFEQIIEELAL